MKQWFMLCAMSVLLAACASSSSTKLKEKQSDIYSTAGIEALQQGDFTGALGSLKEAIKFSPKSAPIWVNLGYAYAGKKEYARAESSWKKALELDEEATDAHLNLGALYLEQKKYPAAEKQLKEVLKNLSYEKLAVAQFNLGFLYSAQGKNLLAQQHYRLAVDEDPSYCPAWFKLAHLQADQEKLEEAAESYKKAVSGTCFNNPRAHYELGNLYIKAKEPALAKSKLLELIQFFPTTEWAKKAEITLNMIR
jgi:Tfp pilus assembly protein PilF